MRILKAAIVIALIGSLMWTLFVWFRTNDTKVVAPRPSAAQLKAEGMTWSPHEDTVYLGPFPIISNGIWQRGSSRRVTFQALGGRHYEAHVTCDHPRIKSGVAYIYARIRNKVWRPSTGEKLVTYYVVCADAPHDNTRGSPSG